MAGEDFESPGVYVFHEESTVDQLVRGATQAQNRLVENIALAVDGQFPPDEYITSWGNGYISPGQIVRQFLIKEE